MDSTHKNHTVSQLSEDYHQDDEIAIIGGGASGLASAYFLIESGHNPLKITISEKNDYVGGHARTLYLHKVSESELYVIQDYNMEFENNYQDVFLRFVDHNNAEQYVKVNGNAQIIPVDIGVCGFSVNYRNFSMMLSRLADQEGVSFLQYDYLEEVSRSISLDNLILRSDKPVGGQLWKPWNWYRIVRLKREIKEIVAYCDRQGIPYWQTKTVSELLGELKAQSVSQDTLDLLCAFCQVGSGYTDAQFQQISAGYLYTFFIQGNFHNSGEDNTTFIYGVSVYIHKLSAYLQNQGVRIEKDRDAPAKHTIYAIQPYDARKLTSDLPEISHSKSLLYVHCDQSIQGDVDTVLSYGNVNGIAQATWDLDRMRPDHPDVGAYITFTIPDHESTIDKQFFGSEDADILRDDLGNAHNLYSSPLKKVWRHAVIDVPAEETRREIWKSYQGKGGQYYCSSSYQYCMLHENAITSALDVVCMLTGEYDRLAGLGYQASDLTLELHGV